MNPLRRRELPENDGGPRRGCWRLVVFDDVRDDNFELERAAEYIRPGRQHVPPVRRGDRARGPEQAVADAEAARLRRRPSHRRLLDRHLVVSVTAAFRA